MSEREHIQGAINRMKETVKSGKLKLKRGKLKARVLKHAKEQIPDFERDKICKDARKESHSAVANMKRDVSNQVRDDLRLN